MGLKETVCEVFGIDIKKNKEDPADLNLEEPKTEIEKTIEENKEETVARADDQPTTEPKQNEKEVGEYWRNGDSRRAG